MVHRHNRSEVSFHNNKHIGLFVINTISHYIKCGNYHDYASKSHLNVNKKD